MQAAAVSSSVAPAMRFRLSSVVAAVVAYLLMYAVAVLALGLFATALLFVGAKFINDLGITEDSVRPGPFLPSWLWISAYLAIHIPVSVSVSYVLGSALVIAPGMVKLWAFRPKSRLVSVVLGTVLGMAGGAAGVIGATIVIYFQYK